MAREQEILRLVEFITISEAIYIPQHEQVSKRSKDALLAQYLSDTCCTGLENAGVLEK